ncbi:hypothetical protein FXV77_19500 [Sphingobacterium phlebotomi]|uniref:Uncharacterized protein n=1 Tax=Sphingobacterium phlebotomi TaxID=2605433 RepID=A0A5D4GTJ2_9SPHI|nr:hypothetical protein [Sphingobacterium phlebotomi]TYR32191.1 hypothetical protein FXV77_19500 [Sphingobacterium phlebotomi]
MRFKLLLLLNKAKRNAAMGIYIQLIIFLQQQYTLISNFIDTDSLALEIRHLQSRAFTIRYYLSPYVTAYR